MPDMGPLAGLEEFNGTIEGAFIQSLVLSVLNTQSPAVKAHLEEIIKELTLADMKALQIEMAERKTRASLSGDPEENRLITVEELLARLVKA